MTYYIQKKKKKMLAEVIIQVSAKGTSKTHPSRACCSNPTQRGQGHGKCHQTVTSEARVSPQHPAPGGSHQQ